MHTRPTLLAGMRLLRHDRARYDAPRPRPHRSCCQPKTLNEASCAFFRHAVRWWYTALSRVHREGAIFVWQSTFYTPLTKFREAVIRYAVQIRRHYIHRKHTNFTEVVPATQRARFSTLLNIQQDGTYTLTDALTQAIQDAKLAHETRVAAAPP